VTSKLNDQHDLGGVGAARQCHLVNRLRRNAAADRRHVRHRQWGQVLQESVVATTTTAAWNVGDLLVLVGNGSSSNSQTNTNDANVLVYRAASISGVLGGSGPRSAPDLIIIAPRPVSGGGVPARHGFLAARCTLRNTTLAGTAFRLAGREPSACSRLAAGECGQRNLNAGIAGVWSRRG